MVHEMGRVFDVGEVAAAVLLVGAVFAALWVVLWLLDRVVVQRVRLRRIERAAAASAESPEDVAERAAMVRLVTDTHATVGEVRELLGPVSVVVTAAVDAIVGVEAFDRMAVRLEKRDKDREATSYVKRSA